MGWGLPIWIKSKKTPVDAMVLGRLVYLLYQNAGSAAVLILCHRDDNVFCRGVFDIFSVSFDMRRNAKNHC